MEGSVSISLEQRKIESLLVSKDCTKAWLSTDGIKNLTDTGNLKSPPRRVIVTRILKTWEELTPELVSSLNISVDRSEDDAVHCFKAGQPWAFPRLDHVKNINGFTSTFLQPL